MTTLAVPAPSLALEAPGPGLATLEKPLTITSGEVLLPDGSPITDATLGVVAGFFIYRVPPASNAVQIWDEAQKSWLPATASAALSLKPKPLRYRQGEPAPWEGLFVASAEKDAVQETTSSYSFRTFFQAPFVGKTLSGLSTPTSAVRFLSASETMRAGLLLDSPDSATEITLYLRNASRVTIGSVLLAADGGTARIEISNFAGAVVRLNADGDIELRPAPGREVVIDGPLRAQEIFYEPHGGGASQWLP